MAGKCCIVGCDRPARSLGMCSVHYRRARDGKSMAAPVRQVLRHLSDGDRIKAKILVAANGCWEWQASRTPLGYGQMRFRGTRELAHRAAWIVFCGPIPKDDSAYGTLGVLHRCDNPSCVNPEHLFLGDQRSNAIDSVSKKRWGPRGCKGESHGRAIVTEEIVRAIRASSETARQCAEKYGLSIGAIRHIRAGRSWKHVV
jgi:hypothetical protein